MWRSMDSVPGSLAAAPRPITARPAITIASAEEPEVIITESPDISAPAMKMQMPQEGPANRHLHLHRRSADVRALGDYYLGLLAARDQYGWRSRSGLRSRARR